MKRDDGMSAVKSRSRGKLLTDFWDSGYNAEGFIAEESLLKHRDAITPYDHDS